MPPGDLPLLDAEACAFFATHGWLIVRGVVDVERVADLERALDAIYAVSPPAPRGAGWELPSISVHSPVIAGHARDPSIARRAADALGCASVQLLQDTVLVKPGGGGGVVAWHQDHTYTGYLDPPRVVSVRLALTECAPASGCMEVIDGSHAWGPIGDVRALTESRVEDALGARADEWQDRVVKLELAPGDVSIHHCLTLHRSVAANGDAARAQDPHHARLFDSACTLRRERLPAGYAAHFPVDEAGHLSRAVFPIL